MRPMFIRRPKRGYSIHLGGPWYLISSPDSGRLYYAKDYGPGTVEVNHRLVPPEARAKVEGYRR